MEQADHSLNLKVRDNWHGLRQNNFKTVEIQRGEFKGKIRTASTAYFASEMAEKQAEALKLSGPAKIEFLSKYSYTKEELDVAADKARIWERLEGNKQRPPHDRLSPAELLSAAVDIWGVPRITLDYWGKNEAKKQGLETGPLGVVVSKCDSIIAMPDVPDNLVLCTALACKIATVRVKEKLGIKAETGPIPIQMVGGALRLKTGQRVPAVVDLDGPNQINIKMSVENIRLSFNLPHDKVNVEDPVVCFAVAAHEVCDWVQSIFVGHDGSFNTDEDDERGRAIKHKNSKSEQFSNQVASELVNELFGWTVTFNENDETIYTREPG